MRQALSAALFVFYILSVVSPGLADVTAQEVFDELKKLEGTWRGSMEGEGEEAAEEAEAGGEAVHEIKVSAAGSVVMETMGPGTEHEMINMYHLDGDQLMLTHYCAAGNQPQMKLDRVKSTADTLVFDFVGGTNLDPAKDHHIHAAKIHRVGDDEIESKWFSWADGKQAATMTFHLSRSE